MGLVKFTEWATRAVEARLLQHLAVLKYRLPPTVVADLSTELETGKATLEVWLSQLGTMDGEWAEEPPVRVWLRWAAEFAEGAVHRSYFEAELRAVEARHGDSNSPPRKVVRGDRERFSLTVEVYGSGLRRYRSGQRALGEARLGGASALPPADPFTFLFPGDAEQRAFCALDGNPSAAGHAVSLRIVPMEPTPGAWPLWTLQTASHRLQWLAGDDRALWTVEFAAPGATDEGSGLSTVGVPRVLVMGKECPYFGALRSRLQAHNAEYGAPETARHLASRGDVSNALRLAPPDVVVVAGPLADASLPELLTLLRGGRRVPLLLWATGETARLTLDAAESAMCAVDLGAGTPAVVGDLLGRVASAVLLDGEDPVEALHRVLLSSTSMPEALRDHARRHLRLFAQYCEWDAKPVPRARRPHPRTTLDRRAQREMVAGALQNLHGEGERVAMVIGTGRAEDDLVALGPALQRHLRDIDPAIRLYPVPAQPLKAPAPIDSDPIDWLLRTGIDTQVLAAHSDEDARQLAHAIGHRLRSTEPSSNGLHWFEVGIGVGLDAATAAERIDSWWRVLHAIHPHFGSASGRLVVFVAVLPDAGEVLRETHEDLQCERRAPCVILDAISSKVTRLDLKRYFTDRRYSPDTVDREPPLTEAVLTYSAGDYAKAMKALVFGLTNGWDQLVLQVESKDYRPIDQTQVDFNFFDRTEF